MLVPVGPIWRNRLYGITKGKTEDGHDVSFRSPSYNADGVCPASLGLLGQAVGGRHVRLLSCRVVCVLFA